VVPADKAEEDALLELALEAGADDVRRSDGKFEVTCDPSVYQQVAEALKGRNVPTELSQISRIPTTTVDLDAETGRAVLKLLEQLDDHDDVQSVSANFNIPEAALAELGAG
jgi:transcriptional/translational regulatory protein YebC/TACO1